MAYRIVDERLGAQPIADTSTTPRHALGTMVRAVDDTYGESVFIYLKGVFGTVPRALVTFDQKTGNTTLTVTDAIGVAAIAMAATGASEYGWYQVRGSAEVLSSDAVAGTVAYYVGDGGPGEVTSTPASGTLVDGMVFATATGTPSVNFAVAELAFPCISGNSGAFTP